MTRVGSQRHSKKKKKKSREMPIPVVPRSKAWVCGSSLAGIACSNPAGGIDVCVLYVLCVVR